MSATYESEAVRAAWGEWLSSEWAWSHWATLTHDPRSFAKGSATHTGVGWARSDRDWRRWLGALAEQSGVDPDAVYWFRGREPNKVRYGTHFHALLGGIEAGCGDACYRSDGQLMDLCRGPGWALWAKDHGLAKVEHYQPDKGAGYYVAKYVTKPIGDYTFSPNLGRHKIGAENDGNEWGGQLGWSGR